MRCGSASNNRPQLSIITLVRTVSLRRAAASNGHGTDHKDSQAIYLEVANCEEREMFPAVAASSRSACIIKLF